jgi:tetratricopeptide (TPR) repeat protein
MDSWCAIPASDLKGEQAAATPSAVPAAPARAGLRSRAALYCGLGLLLLGVVAFLPSLGNGFTNYDDPAYVTANPQVQAGLSASGVWWALNAVVSANWHPLTLLSHMLDCELFGLDPRGHHWTSLVLHLLAVVLLFEVLRRMTGRALPSAAAAALFAVHPLRVESVAWVAERKDVLCGVLWMLTLAAWLRYSRRPSPGRYLPVGLAFALALMAKPMAVTLPVVLLLLDFWPLGRWRLPAAGAADEGSAERRGWRSWLPPRNLVVEKLPLLALAFGASLLTLQAQSDMVRLGAAQPAGVRIANALTSVFAYLGKTVLPVDLAVMYPFPAHIAAWKAAAAAVALAGLTLGSLAAARRAPWLTVGWLWYLVTLAPVAGVVQVGFQAMADRYTYLPSIGLFIALSWQAAAFAARRPRWKPALAAAAAVVLALLAWQTRAQLAWWRDSVALFRHSLAVVESPVAHANLAEALRHRGDHAEALVHYRAAIALQPRNAQGYAALANALRSWREPAAALPYLRASLALDPGDEQARMILAMALDDLGRPREAIDELRKVAAANPRSAQAAYGLGALLERAGARDEALLWYRRALAGDPGRRELRAAIARLDARGGVPAGR